jgi:pilus assembly protein FimV
MIKPTKTIAALCLLNSASIYALGIGEIETHSALNQVLQAKIPLVGTKNEDPSNVIVKIASRDAFKKAGIDRPHYLTQLKFTPVTGEGGNISVEVRSSDTVKEPFVNFLLEVEWPQGRALKEFTILLDPPVTMSDVRTTPLALPKSPTITATSPATTQVTTYVAPAPQVAPKKEYGPTKSRDTVWGIAKNLIKNNHTVTHQQMMLALYDNNPKAFYKKNINALKKGAILQVPSDTQIASRTSAQANSDYAQQNSLWSARNSVAKKAAPETSKPNNEALQTAAASTDVKKKPENNVSEAKLTLLTPTDDSKKEVEVAVEGNASDTPVGSTNPSQQANMAIEMATTLEEENKEVKSRLNDLETQVDKLQRLLALKDEQLAQLHAVKPVETKPVKAPEPVVSNESDDSNIPLYGGALVLALLGLFLARRKKESNSTSDEFQVTKPNISEPKPEQAVQVTEESTADTTIEEEPLLSEFTPSEFDSNAQTQEADPITECDVYIAYGRFQQAEDLIQNALESDPDNLAYKQKLLDVYYASQNAESFEELASSLSTLKDSDPSTWGNIVDMGTELCPDSPLFLAPFNEDEEEIDVSAPETNDAIIDLDSSLNKELEQESSTPEDDKATEDDFNFDFDLIKNDSSAVESMSDDSEDASSNEIDPNEDTKLSLAQAYIEMEDFASAREALNEVLVSGDESQKEKAQKMLDSM